MPVWGRGGCLHGDTMEGLGGEIFKRVIQRDMVAACMGTCGRLGGDTVAVCVGGQWVFAWGGGGWLGGDTVGLWLW